MNFSILMSVYSGEKLVYLQDAFKSIWYNQTMKPSEIVIVVDGPIGTEITDSISYWKNRLGSTLKIIPISYNVGLGRALNEGLKHCTNEWVFRMDTDDICTPDRFEKQIKFISENPDIVLFSSQIIEFDKDIKDATTLRQVPICHDDIVKFSNKRSPFNHMTVAYKKSVIDGLGGYQHHPYMEDYNLWLRVIGAGHKVGNHPDVLLYARVGNGMHTRRKGFEYIKSEKQLLDLKKSLSLQNPIQANLLFVLRSLFRLLPSSTLAKVYNSFLRKKVNKV